ncbi:phage uncharacterized protein TIGR01671 [Paenibacillaceae bacterium GAS479]|nr:phage uncharacterized protein TIGR01671 [Paenibacillaceae bacterium GAS479]
MREYKYRGRRIDNGEWVYGSLIAPDKIVGPIVEWDEDYFCTEFWLKVDPATVGQYVGLKDKAEIEIYEGDISEELDFKHGACFPVQPKKKVIVQYVDSKASFNLTAGIDYTTGLYKGVIIGNIHQHPHLLKEGEG